MNPTATKLIETKPKIVVMGGGTGTSVVLSGLKRYDVDLTAIISMADSGGSTGRLRDEFGFQPVGDLRQALAALSQEDHYSWIRKLLLYRFSIGSGLEGHNIGNLMLTALQDLTHSTTQALEIASTIFRLKGTIYPITTTNIQLVIEYDDGTVEIGEKVLDEKHGGKHIASIKTSPRASIYDKAKTAIESANLIVIGPGDLYGSILPNLIIEGTKEAFYQSSAKVVYITNLMTHYTQTHNMTVLDHVQQIETALDHQVDTVIINSSEIPSNILTLYKQDHEYPVIDDSQLESKRFVRGNFIRPVAIKSETMNPDHRSYIRHDPKKLAHAIIQLIRSERKQ